jgi:hypothetical protein
MKSKNTVLCIFCFSSQNPGWKQNGKEAYSSDTSRRTESEETEWYYPSALNVLFLIAVQRTHIPSAIVQPAEWISNLPCDPLSLPTGQEWLLTVHPSLTKALKLVAQTWTQRQTYQHQLPQLMTGNGEDSIRKQVTALASGTTQIQAFLDHSYKTGHCTIRLSFKGDSNISRPKGPVIFQSP